MSAKEPKKAKTRASSKALCAEASSSESNKDDVKVEKIEESTTTQIEPSSIVPAVAARPKKALPLGVVGMKNLKNTCFVNSVIQSLSNCESFRQYFQDLPFTNGPPVNFVCWEMKKLLSDIWSGYYQVLSPLSLLTAIQTKGVKYTFGVEEDAHWFLQVVLQILDEELVALFKNEDVSVSQLFAIKRRREILCSKCKLLANQSSSSSSCSSSSNNNANNSNNNNNSNSNNNAAPPSSPMISPSSSGVPVLLSPDRHGCKRKLSALSSSSSSSNPVCQNFVTNYFGNSVNTLYLPEKEEEELESCTLEDCLSRSRDAFDLSYQHNPSICVNCNNTCDQHETMAQLPRILCFHFNRYRWTGKVINRATRSGAKGKINTQIHFPTKLDMSAFIISPSSKQKLREKPRPYSLASVVVHDGLTPATGHYYTFSYNTVNGKWYKFDDDRRPKEVSESCVLKANPFMLMYQYL